ncbi:protein-export chaperone SecB [Coxiella endosymbiont of Amblyomma americanum]|uniref:protein-export chaperone SecB n=1 Tax=Coxiella endosymbiont of Amblyomma americanum TaxID=325775 RepID=UPI00057EB7E5|nr:protein-export chaperone SecB [Coxiella endosymbiont of Amblyomma americanum]AJC50244.1 preprotein translocase subunit SecB [Coxiella endosymbiont of Amblyomma americanum]AUJ58603.1 preprotein translocase subunit SecB [Coxiella-like endosymbiont of Amblyomma americanum]
MAEKQNVNQSKHNPEFTIQRLYVKDSSFESPHSPQVFFEVWRPELNLDLTTKANDLGNNNHEVVLVVKATVKMEARTIFIAEIFQAGIFVVKNFPEDQIRPVLESLCPNILYPYAREAITDMVVRGGFPHLYLAPINFDSLLEKRSRIKGCNDRGRMH